MQRVGELFPLHLARHGGAQAHDALGEVFVPGGFDARGLRPAEDDLSRIERLYEVVPPVDHLGGALQPDDGGCQPALCGRHLCGPRRGLRIGAGIGNFRLGCAEQGHLQVFGHIPAKDIA